MASQVCILNYTKDQKPFWNQLCLSPVKDEHGVVYYLGIQTNVTGAVLSFRTQMYSPFNTTPAGLTAELSHAPLSAFHLAAELIIFLKLATLELIGCPWINASVSKEGPKTVSCMEKRHRLKIPSRGILTYGQTNGGNAFEQGLMAECTPLRVAQTLQPKRSK